MYSYARLLAGTHVEAEDLLQDGLLRAFRAFGSYKPHLSFKVWVFAIMKHAHLDRARRRSVRPTEEGWDEDPELTKEAEDAGLYMVPLNPEEIVLRDLRIEEVNAAIRRLPLIFREVVELREIEGLSYKEIAEIVQAPIGTVMSRLYRGRHLLRASLHAPLAKESEGGLKSGRHHDL